MIAGHGMPIYEFLCGDCKRITNHFTRKIDTESNVPCEHCQSDATERLISNFARTYSRSDVLEKYGDPGTDGSAADIRDPRQIGSWVEKRFDEYGIDMPESAREMIDAAREGEMPGPVKDL